LKKQNLFLYISSTVILIIIWTVFIFIPNNRVQNKLAVQLHEGEKQLNDYKRTMNELNDFIKIKEELKNKKNELNSKLYSKKEILQLFDQLEEHSLKQNLSLTEISPPVEELIHLNSFVPDSVQPQFITINLKLEGKYVDFGKFVRSIEDANFFRGTKHCQIISIDENVEKTYFYLTFKALLCNYIGDVS